MTLHTDTQNSEQTFGVHIENVVDARRGLDNQEVAMRVQSGVRNGGRFHTDLNGLGMQARMYMDKLPLQGNFYPLPTQVRV